VTERASKRAANPPTGTVAFLFTDIEGSIAMWERNPARMQAALARHDEILRATVERTIPPQALPPTQEARRERSFSRAVFGAEAW
jgi:hypothetical protein